MSDDINDVKLPEEQPPVPALKATATFTILAKGTPEEITQFVQALPDCVKGFEQKSYGTLVSVVTDANGGRYIIDSDGLFSRI